ncbi:hypothetical protein HDE_05459 [Halotydeus destructor]|nr:hypothetical protein HDE_05459 [Halotydeus destructor]
MNASPTSLFSHHLQRNIYSYTPLASDGKIGHLLPTPLLVHGERDDGRLKPGCNVYLRSSKSFNCISKPSVTLIRRKSAVERLEESKAQYVKSDQVRESRQPVALFGGKSDTDVRLDAKQPPSWSPSVVASQSRREMKLEPDCRLNCTLTKGRSFREGCCKELSPTTSGGSNCSLEAQLRQLITSSQDSLDYASGTRAEKRCSEKKKKSEGNDGDHRNYQWSITHKLYLQSNTCLSERSKQNHYPLTPVPRQRKNLEVKVFEDDEKRHLVRNCIERNTSFAASHTIQSLTLPRREIGTNYSNGATPAGTMAERRKTDIGPSAPIGASSRPSLISRSKSDIGHRLMKNNNLRNNNQTDDLDRFFATIGLDSSTWISMTQNESSMTSTPTRFFDSIDSLDSVPKERRERERMEAVKMRKTKKEQQERREKQVSRRLSVSSKSSSLDDESGHHDEPALLVEGINRANSGFSFEVNDGDEGGEREGHRREEQPACGQSKKLTLSLSLSSHGLSRETSIVEKNARVIKWLYNCRKATASGQAD